MSDPDYDAIRAATNAATMAAKARAEAEFLANAKPDKHGRTYRLVDPPARWGAKVGQQVRNRKSGRRAVILAVRMIERDEHLERGERRRRGGQPKRDVKRVQVPRVILATETGGDLALSPDALWQKWEPVNEATVLEVPLPVVAEGGEGGGQDAEGGGVAGASLSLPPLREVSPDQRPGVRGRGRGQGVGEAGQKARKGLDV